MKNRAISSTPIMGTNWLLCVDDTIWAKYAFNYTLSLMHKDIDHLYIFHVSESVSPSIFGYATSSLIEGMTAAEEKRSKKILTHFGRLAEEAGIEFTMMRGVDPNPGAYICSVANIYNVSTIVIGRRCLGKLERFFIGSISKYVMENAECNVIIVKKEFGAFEEHESREEIIKEEEAERLRRIEELENVPEVIHDATREEVIEAEEQERKRRLKEDTLNTKTKPFVQLYKFQEELKQKIQT